MAVIHFHPLTDDALKLGRYVEASLSASKVPFDRFGATLRLQVTERHLFDRSWQAVQFAGDFKAES